MGLIVLSHENGQIHLQIKDDLSKRIAGLKLSTSQDSSRQISVKIQHLQYQFMCEIDWLSLPLFYMSEM